MLSPDQDPSQITSDEVLQILSDLTHLSINENEPGSTTGSLRRNLAKKDNYLCGDASHECAGQHCRCASMDIPGNLQPSNTPQFVLVTFDDAVTPATKAVVDELLAGIQSAANSCPVKSTFFVSTDWTHFSFVHEYWAAGHEIAAHTITHSTAYTSTADYWRNEIVGSKHTLSTFANIPQEDIKGFRAPYLQYAELGMQALKNAGFRYDSSIREYGNAGEYSGSLLGQYPNKIWPYTMDHGVGQHCDYSHGDCQTWAFQGVWEVPVWSQDNSDGTAFGVFDVYDNETLEHNFMTRYNNNRAPMGLWLHPANIELQNAIPRLRDFLEFAAAQPNTYFVTMDQLLNWVANPVGIAEGAAAAIGCPTRTSDCTIQNCDVDNRAWPQCVSQCPANWPTRSNWQSALCQLPQNCVEPNCICTHGGMPSPTATQTMTPSATATSTTGLTPAASVSGSPSVSFSATQSPLFGGMCTGCVAETEGPCKSLSNGVCFFYDVGTVTCPGGTSECFPRPTPSQTPSISTTASATPSVSESATETATASASNTPTSSISESPSPSISDSSTPTTSASPSISESTTPTPSVSISATTTPSNTPSLSESASISLSPTMTPSATISNSATPSLGVSCSECRGSTSGPCIAADGACANFLTGTNTCPQGSFKPCESYEGSIYVAAHIYLNGISAAQFTATHQLELRTALSQLLEVSLSTILIDTFGDIGDMTLLEIPTESASPVPDRSLRRRAAASDKTVVRLVVLSTASGVTSLANSMAQKIASGDFALALITAGVPITTTTFVEGTSSWAYSSGNNLSAQETTSEAEGPSTGTYIWVSVVAVVVVAAVVILGVYCANRSKSGPESSDSEGEDEMGTSKVTELSKRAAHDPAAHAPPAAPHAAPHVAPHAAPHAPPQPKGQHAGHLEDLKASDELRPAAVHDEVPAAARAKSAQRKQRARELALRTSGPEYAPVMPGTPHDDAVTPSGLALDARTPSGSMGGPRRFASRDHDSTLPPMRTLDAPRDSPPPQGHLLDSHTSPTTPRAW